MSEAVAAPAPTAVSVPEKRAQVEALLGDIFRLAEWPARLETKEAPDGGIAVAVHFEGEVPGVTSGKKGYLLDSLQFLVNKVVNRPGVEKRWVTLGVGAFPEPKPAGGPAPAPQPSAPKPQRSTPQPQRSAPQPPKRSAPREAVPAEPEVEMTPEWSALGKLLAGKAAKHGRPYAVMLLAGGERVQLTKAATGAGLKVRTEGDGHFRRVALVPDKLVPMPRKMQFPDDDDGDDDEG